MKRVLITGGCGFLGSAFLRYLHSTRTDFQITNFDLLTYAADPERLSELAGEKRYTFRRGDVADSEQVRALFGDAGPFDLVFHFAAETHVDRSLADAAPFVRTNVIGTQVMLDAFRTQSAGRFVHISTDEVYGPLPPGDFAAEDSPLAPRNPYAATKAGADHLVRAYGRSFGIDYNIVRSVNVFGPAQYPEKFIPLAVASLLEGQPIPLYGDGMQVRDWLYVDDYVRGVLLIAEAGHVGEIYHISAGSEQPNRVVAESICALLDVPVAAGITNVDDRPGHDRRYGLSSARLRGMGWLPETDFGTGLRRTVEWFREHPRKPAPAPGRK